jgi:RNA polymerase sigma-70 factor (ECF subfamily)
MDGLIRGIDREPGSGASAGLSSDPASGRNTPSGPADETAVELRRFHPAVDVPERRLYLLLPLDLAPRLHEPLCAHFATRREVEVIVERRARTRPPVPFDSAASARLGSLNYGGGKANVLFDRRARALPVEARQLPEVARECSGRLMLVERLEPSTQEAEDRDAAGLVARVLAGDLSAFSFIHMRYYARIYGYLRAKVPVADAEDLAQDVFIRAFAALPVYEGRAPFRAWLYLIANNAAVDHLRKHGRVELLGPRALDRLSEELDRAQMPGIPGRLQDGQLGPLIGRLTENARKVIVLHYELGFTLRDTALTLGLSEKAVYHHHERALAMLRTRLSAAAACASAAETLPIRRLAWQPATVLEHSFSIMRRSNSH